MAGNPINTATGNKFQEETDYAGTDLLQFARYYNSGALATSHLLGSNWTNSYTRRIETVPDFPSVIGVRRPDGSITTFVLMEHIWTSKSDPAASLQKFTDASGQLTGWSYRKQDGREIEDYDAAGRLIGITRTNGQSVVLTYNGSLPVTITSSDGRSLVLEYDSSSRLHQLTDPTGAVYVYAYDAANRLQSVTYPGGTTKTYLYNEAAFTAGADLPTALTGIVDENAKRFATFTYQADGRAVSTEHAGGGAKVTVSYGTDGTSQVGFPSGVVQQRGFVTPNDLIQNSSIVISGSMFAYHTFDALGYPNSDQDAAGTLTNHTYSARGLETQLVESANVPATKRTTQTDWDPVFNVPVERRLLNSSDTLESKSTWTYNARGQVLTATQVHLTNASLSRTTTYTYCEATDVAAGACPIVGLLRSVDGPLTSAADITTYTYRQADEASCAAAPITCPYRKGDLWKVTNALGQVTETLAYDGAGRPLSVKNPNGVVTDLEYSPRGWLTARKVRGALPATEADDAITRLEYDATGTVHKITLPDGNYSVFTYDDAHRLYEIADAMGNSIHYTLDNAGNRRQEDTWNNALQVKKTLSRVFNTLGQLQSDSDAQGRPIDFTYTANGDLDTVRDRLLRLTDNDVDALGRLTQSIANTGGGTSDKATTQFQYDARDNLRTVIDPKGLSTIYNYDSLGNLSDQSSPDTGATLFGYDLAGRRTSETKADGVTHGFSFDSIGRLAGQTFAHSAQNISYTYDVTQGDCAASEGFSLGRLTKITDAAGNTRYCYDRFGNRVRQVQTLASGSTLTVGTTYSAAGRLSAMTYPSGAIVTYSRNANGQPVAIDIKPTPTSTQISLVSSVTYLPFGPVNTITFGNGRVLSKNYDSNYDIDSVTDSASSNPMSEDLTVDANGNVTGLTEQTGTSTTVSRTFTYDGLDRLTAQKNGATTIEGFSYNSTGDRLSKAAGSTTNYTYPSTSHRLSAVGSTNRTYLAAGETQSIGTGGSSKNFTYDDKHRLSTYKQNNSLKYTNQYNGRGERVAKISTTSGNSRQFVYDEAGHLLGEYTTTGALVREYVWLDDTLVGTIGGYGSTAYQYVETDHLGTPRAVVSPGNNAIVWRWDVNPTAFGEHLPAENPDGDSFNYQLNLRSPGQYYDSESGLSYNYFRDYDAGSGRYVESDPIGLGGGLSTYGYAGSSPLGAIDPTGLVLWHGTSYALQFGELIQYAEFRFSLFSECVNGKMAFVQVEAVGIGTGGGDSPVTNTGGQITFDDGKADLDTGVFNGAFGIWNAGVTVGIGFGWTNATVGQAVSTGNWGVQAGFEPGWWSFTTGSSSVYRKAVFDCGCQK